MSINVILPLISTAILLAFAVFILRRFTATRKLHFLFWGLGLLMFSTATFAEAYLGLAWNRWVFFSWYLFGAVLNAAWLGHGTLYLLVRKKWVHTVTVILLLASLAALVLMLQIMPRLDAGQFTTAGFISDQYRTIMPDGAIVRSSTPFFNIYGTITLVGGALWSAYLFWRKRVLPNRVIGNVLIAAGALLIASASTLTRLGNGSLLYIGELGAAILMFSGFIFAAKPQPGEKEVALPAAAQTST